MNTAANLGIPGAAVAAIATAVGLAGANVDTGIICLTIVAVAAMAAATVQRVWGE